MTPCPLPLLLSLLLPPVRWSVCCGACSVLVGAIIILSCGVGSSKPTSRLTDRGQYGHCRPPSACRAWPVWWSS
eukprot:7217469-Pyramimonas_sp.AAC.1